jgi:predicted Zn-dependent protease
MMNDSTTEMTNSAPNIITSEPEYKLEQELKTLVHTPMGRRLFLASLPVLLAACSSSKSNSRYREGSNEGQHTELTPEDEKKLTQEVLPQMKKDYPAHPNKEAQIYVKELGEKIVKANNLEGKPYRYNFTLVDVGYVNAFALPAGEIMVTAPLLAMADSEAELSGVIGHEVGHVVARHTAERMQKAKDEQKKTWLMGIGGGVIGGAAGFLLGKTLCKSTDPKYRECLQKAALYGAAAGAGGALLIQKYAFMANSREDEMEADRIGFKTSVAAGFNKDHVGSFYEKLLEMEKKHKQGSNNFLASFADALSTHPPSAERVKQMQEMARQTPATPKSVVSSKKFDQIKSVIGTDVQRKAEKKST